MCVCVCGGGGGTYYNKGAVLSLIWLKGSSLNKYVGIPPEIS